MDQRGFFPSGLLYLIWQWQKANKIKLEVLDKRKRPLKRPLDERSLVPWPFTPHPWQIDAVKAALAFGRGIIVAPTGVGKSLVIGLICQSLGLKTLIVTPTLGLKRQTLDALRARFGDLVGEQEDERLFTVENVDALDPNVPGNYDCVIIDEFHRSGANKYRRLNRKAWNNIYFRFGLTATPFRSRSEERLLLESVLEKVIYRLPYAESVRKDYIVGMEAYYVDLPPTKCGDCIGWRETYERLVVKNEYRNRLIAQMIDSLALASKSVLCLVKEIEQGEQIIEFTESKPVFSHGEADNNTEILAAFNARRIKPLVGTVGVMGEGMDTRATEYVIIAGLGKSKNQFMQNLGRSFRRFGAKETCKIIIFRDASHPWTLRHYRAQVRYLKEEYGVVPIKLDLEVLI